MAQKIVDQSKLIVQFERDDSRCVVVDGELVRFNGIGEDGHDRFFFDRCPNRWPVPGKIHVSAFCKTAHKPYDAVVCATLLAAKKVFGDDVKVYSDGEWDDWIEGRRLYGELFSEIPAYPFEVKQSSPIPTKESVVWLVR